MIDKNYQRSNYFIETPGKSHDICLVKIDNISVSVIATIEKGTINTRPVYTSKVVTEKGQVKAQVPPGAKFDLLTAELGGPSAKMQLILF